MPRSLVHGADHARWLPGAALAAVILTVMSACSDRLPTTPPPLDPAFVISDGGHSNGNSHFFFLPPLVPNPTTTGVFDGALSPTIDICEYAGGCVATVAQFSTSSGTGGATVDIDASAKQYMVNWDTKTCIWGACALDPAKTYRLQVLVDGILIGFADVDVVSKGSELKNVQTGEYIGLLNGRTLPVKFRIDVDMLLSIALSPSPANLAVGESLQLTATMRNAHGVVITGPILSWSSSNPALATVDVNGVVTAIEPGGVTVTALADGMNGTADITVRKIPASLTIDATTLSQTYDGTPRVVGVTTSPPALPGVTVTYDGSSTPPTSAGSYAVLATLNNAHYEAAPAAGTLVVATAGSAVEVSSGGGQACALATDATMACWGDNGLGATNAPPGTYLQVAAGQLHSCGLRTDGSATCWGYGGYSETGTYAGPFVQITAGANQSCAPDGVGFCWGGAGPAPAGTYTQLSAGGGFQCGVTTSGALACTANLVPPAGTFIQVSAGWSNACAVRTDHTVACWGGNNFGQSSPPSGTFTQVSAAYQHTCGVRTDGTVACWGWNSGGQASPPAGTFRQVSGGNEFTCGVRTDGYVQCWGAGTVTSVPTKFSVPVP